MVTNGFNIAGYFVNRRWCYYLCVGKLHRFSLLHVYKLNLRQLQWRNLKEFR